MLNRSGDSVLLQSMLLSKLGIVILPKATSLYISSRSALTSLTSTDSDADVPSRKEAL